MIRILKSKLQAKLKEDAHFAELVKGSGIAFVPRIFGIISGYVFTLLVTRNFGAEAMGIFALSFTVLQIASVIGRLGMDTALLRFVAEYSSHGKWELVSDVYWKAIKIVIPFSIVVSITLFGFSPFLANYVFHKKYLEFYFRIISLAVVPFVLLFINRECLRGLKKILEYSIFQNFLLFSCASVFLILFILNHNFSVSIPIIACLFSILFNFLLSLLLWLKALKNKKIFQEMNLGLKIPYRKLLDVAIPMLFASSLALIMGWTDILMLGALASEREVGIYNVVLRLVMTLNIVLLAVDSISSPNYASYYNSAKMKEFQEIVIKSAKLTFFFSLPLIVAFIMLPKFWLSIFGKEFVAGSMALIILSGSRLVRFLCGPTPSILGMTGKQKVYRDLLFLSLILNIVLNYMLIPKFSINGAAVSTFFSISFLSISACFYIKFKMGINPTFIKLNIGKTNEKTL